MLLWIAPEHELPPIGNDEFRGYEKQANRRIAFDQNGNGAADSLRKHWTEIRSETGRLIDDINRLKGGVSEKRLETVNEDLQDIRTVMADQGMWATLHAHGEAYGLLADVEAWVKQTKTGKGPKATNAPAAAPAQPTPKPESPAAPSIPVESPPAAQPAKDPALQWHKPVSNPCSVCGVNEPRLKALHRMLSPEEQDRTGCKYLKSVKVSFGGDSEETCIGERVPRIAAAKRLSAVLLQPSGFTKKDIYGSNSTNLGAESLRAAMENLRRDGVLVRDYSSNAPRRTGYETREELEKLTAEMSKEEHSTWHVVGVSEQGITADGAANVLKTIRAFGLPEVEVTATIAAIEQTEPTPSPEAVSPPMPTDSTDEAVRRAAEEVARELGFELEPEAPAAAPVVAPTPEPPAPPVESPEEKRARELAERFAKGLSGRMGGKTLSPPSAPEPPAAPASREMSAQEKANAEMAAFLEEWRN
jgi:phage-related protein